MIKFLKIILTGLITSLFLFPFNISGWPMNSKMTLAVIGLVWFVLDKIRSKNASLNKDFIWISIIALGVSAVAQLAVAYNHTQETSYTDYFMSFWTWMGAAYAATNCIKAVHGKLTVRLISNYLIGAAVFQCITAYAIVIFEPVKEIVDSISAIPYSEIGRLYGLGAFLDPSGLRFAAILIITMRCISQSSQDWKASSLYVFAFFVISTIGSMISRSTSIGIILSLGYLIIDFFLHYRKRSVYSGSILTILILSSIVIISITFFYNTDSVFRENLRFGFEGVFSYFEHGHFETNSTNYLKNMFVWPTELKTWIIGDGYLENPYQDPNYLGIRYAGYYMGTDVGYLRFIFFFGIFGLLLMICMFIKATLTCIHNIPEYKLLFSFILLSNLICWIKVSSDIIMVFAPFLILAYQNSSARNLSVKTQNISSPSYAHKIYS